MSGQNIVDDDKKRYVPFERNFSLRWLIEKFGLSTEEKILIRESLQKTELCFPVLMVSDLKVLFGRLSRGILQSNDLYSYTIYKDPRFLYPGDRQVLFAYNSFRWQSQLLRNPELLEYLFLNLLDLAKQKA